MASSISKTTAWPDLVEEIVAGDHAVALAYVTPARGVVIIPVSNFSMHDREKGTITVNSSIGAWKKLDRIRANPQVALAFHTREHASTNRPEYVLVQGRASLSELLDEGWLEAHREEWERFTGPMREFGPLCLVRCFVACAIGPKTTFLRIAFKK